MKDTRRTIIILGFASFGSRMLSLLLEAAENVAASPFLHCAVLIDLERPTIRPPKLPRWVRSFSPDVAEITEVTAGGSTILSAYKTLLEGMINTLVKEANTIPTGNILLAAPVAVIEEIAPVLETLKHRLPQLTIYLLTERPMLSQDRSQDYEVLTKLHKDKVLNTVFLLDTQRDSSPREKENQALMLGTAAREKAFAHTIMGLCVAKLHNTHNPSLVDISGTLGSYAPLTRMRFAVLPLASGQTRKLWPFVRWITRDTGDRGVGAYSDIKNQAEAATKAVIPGHTSAPCVVVYCLPLHPTDTKYQQLIKDIDLFLASECRDSQGLIRVHPVMLSASYPPLPGEEQSYYRLQAACLYPETTYAPVLHRLLPERVDGHQALNVKQDMK